MAPEPQPGEIGADPFVTPVFMIEDCGLTNRQVWTAVMGDLHQSGAISQADVSTWLRDAAILDCASGEVVIGVPHELARRRAAGRYAGSIRQSLERVTGLRVDVSIILFRDWDAA